MSGGRGGVVAVWVARASEPHRLCAAPGGGDVTTLAWTPNGLFFLAGSADGAVRLWCASSGDALRALLPVGPPSRVRSIAVSPGSRFAASGDDDGRLSLWDLPSGALVSSLDAHARGAPVAAVTFSGDGRTLASAARTVPALAADAKGDALVAFWDIPAAVLLWESGAKETRRVHPALKSVLRVDANPWALIDEGGDVLIVGDTV